ncbi:MAG: ABC transporter permease [Proteobacteria bacterium]|nr:ABC transporter permease [Pseudomonadota bacterium]
MKSFIQALLTAVIGLALGSLVALLGNESPVHVIEVIFNGAFGTPYDLGLTIYYGVILTFSGLAVAVPFRAGVFNIGGEGQVVVASFTCAIVAILLGDQWSPFLCAFVGLILGCLAGGLWAGIAGWIKSFRGGHEVISSIMLNFIAAGLTGWLTINHFRASDSQNPETSSIGAAWLWSKLDIFGGAPVTNFSILAVVCCLVVWILFSKTVFGFSLKAVSQSPSAAEIAGIPVARTTFYSMLLGGAFAGLAGAFMVYGDVGRFRMDMSAGFGFMGIPVALLGRAHPVGVLFSAILFAVLHQGSTALDIEATGVGRDLAQVIQAIVVIVVVSQSLFTISFWKRITSKWS